MTATLTRIFGVKCLICCVLVTFLVGFSISILYAPSGNRDDCDCSVVPPPPPPPPPPQSSASIQVRVKSPQGSDDTSETPPSDAHVLGVIVPFRDRFEELLEFAPHMHTFLTNQNVNHKIYIVNQVDQYRFNRASLINIGFSLATSEGCDYIAMHDVDLLPLNSGLSYGYPLDYLYHVASPEFHPKYHYRSFVGGILVVRKEDFIEVNGMSNKYWGWGLEDDEFFVRVREAGLRVRRPINLTTGTANTFRHNHDRVWRKRDMAKCFNQKEVTRRRDRQTGLSDVAYEIKSRRELIVDGASVAVVNVALRCNRTVTPWCLCSEEKKKEGGGGVKGVASAGGNNFNRKTSRS